MQHGQNGTSWRTPSAPTLPGPPPVLCYRRQQLLCCNTRKSPKLDLKVRYSPSLAAIITLCLMLAASGGIRSAIDVAHQGMQRMQWTGVTDADCQDAWDAAVHGSDPCLEVVSSGSPRISLPERTGFSCNSKFSHSIGHFPHFLALSACSRTSQSTGCRLH